MAQQPPERVEGLAIVEKFDQFVEYTYPILQNIPRRHGQFRDRVLNTMFDVPERLYVATKTNQVSRIREVDARLASLRWQLRFAANPKRKIRAYTEARDTEALRFFFAAWLGHAKWADSHNLMKSLARQHRAILEEANVQP